MSESPSSSSGKPSQASTKPPTGKGPAPGKPGGPPPQAGGPRRPQPPPGAKQPPPGAKPPQRRPPPRGPPPKGAKPPAAASGDGFFGSLFSSLSDMAANAPQPAKKKPTTAPTRSSTAPAAAGSVKPPQKQTPEAEDGDQEEDHEDSGEPRSDQSGDSDDAEVDADDEKQEIDTVDDNNNDETGGDAASDINSDNDNDVSPSKDDTPSVEDEDTRTPTPTKLEPDTQTDLAVESDSQLGQSPPRGDILASSENSALDNGVNTPPDGSLSQSNDGDADIDSDLQDHNVDGHEGKAIVAQPLHKENSEDGEHDHKPNPLSPGDQVVSQVHGDVDHDKEKKEKSDDNDETIQTQTSVDTVLAPSPSQSSSTSMPPPTSTPTPTPASAPVPAPAPQSTASSIGSAFNSLFKIPSAFQKRVTPTPAPPPKASQPSHAAQSRPEVKPTPAPTPEAATPSPAPQQQQVTRDQPVPPPAKDSQLLNDTKKAPVSPSPSPQEQRETPVQTQPPPSAPTTVPSTETPTKPTAPALSSSQAAARPGGAKKASSAVPPGFEIDDEQQHRLAASLLPNKYTSVHHIPPVYTTPGQSSAAVATQYLQITSSPDVLNNYLRNQAARPHISLWLNSIDGGYMGGLFDALTPEKRTLLDRVLSSPASAANQQENHQNVENSHDEIVTPLHQYLIMQQLNSQSVAFQHLSSLSTTPRSVKNIIINAQTLHKSIINERLATTARNRELFSSLVKTIEQRLTHIATQLKYLDTQQQKLIKEQNRQYNPNPTTTSSTSDMIHDNTILIQHLIQESTTLIKKRDIFFSLKYCYELSHNKRSTLRLVSGAMPTAGADKSSSSTKVADAIANQRRKKHLDHVNIPQALSSINNLNNTLLSANDVIIESMKGDLNFFLGTAPQLHQYCPLGRQQQNKHLKNQPNKVILCINLSAASFILSLLGVTSSGSWLASLLTARRLILSPSLKQLHIHLIYDPTTNQSSSTTASPTNADWVVDDSSFTCDISLSRGNDSGYLPSTLITMILQYVVPSQVKETILKLMHPLIGEFMKSYTNNVLYFHGQLEGSSLCPTKIYTTRLDLRPTAPTRTQWDRYFGVVAPPKQDQSGTKSSQSSPQRQLYSMTEWDAMPKDVLSMQARNVVNSNIHTLYRQYKTDLVKYTTTRAQLLALLATVNNVNPELQSMRYLSAVNRDPSILFTGKAGTQGGSDGGKGSGKNTSGQPQQQGQAQGQGQGQTLSPGASLHSLHPIDLQSTIHFFTKQTPVDFAVPYIAFPHYRLLMSLFTVILPTYEKDVLSESQSELITIETLRQYVSIMAAGYEHLQGYQGGIISTRERTRRRSMSNAASQREGYKPPHSWSVDLHRAHGEDDTDSIQHYKDHYTFTHIQSAIDLCRQQVESFRATLHEMHPDERNETLYTTQQSHSQHLSTLLAENDLNILNILFGCQLSLQFVRLLNLWCGLVDALSVVPHPDSKAPIYPPAVPVAHHWVTWTFIACFRSQHNKLRIRASCDRFVLAIGLQSAIEWGISAYDSHVYNTYKQSIYQQYQLFHYYRVHVRKSIQTLAVNTKATTATLPPAQQQFVKNQLHTLLVDRMEDLERIYYNNCENLQLLLTQNSVKLQVILQESLNKVNTLLTQCSHLYAEVSTVIMGGQGHIVDFRRVLQAKERTSARRLYWGSVIEEKLPLTIALAEGMNPSLAISLDDSHNNNNNNQQQLSTSGIDTIASNPTGSSTHDQDISTTDDVDHVQLVTPPASVVVSNNEELIHISDMHNANRHTHQQQQQQQDVEDGNQTQIIALPTFFEMYFSANHTERTEFLQNIRVMQESFKEQAAIQQQAFEASIRDDTNTPASSPTTTTVVAPFTPPSYSSTRPIKPSQRGTAYEYLQQQQQQGSVTQTILSMDSVLPVLLLCGFIDERQHEQFYQIYNIKSLQDRRYELLSPQQSPDGQQDTGSNNTNKQNLQSLTCMCQKCDPYFLQAYAIYSDDDLFAIDYDPNHDSILILSSLVERMMHLECHDTTCHICLVRKYCHHSDPTRYANLQGVQSRSSRGDSNRQQQEADQRETVAQLIHKTHQEQLRASQKFTMHHQHALLEDPNQQHDEAILASYFEPTIHNRVLASTRYLLSNNISSAYGCQHYISQYNNPSQALLYNGIHPRAASSGPNAEYLSKHIGNEQRYGITYDNHAGGNKTQSAKQSSPSGIHPGKASGSTAVSPRTVNSPGTRNARIASYDPILHSSYYHQLHHHHHCNNYHCEHSYLIGGSSCFDFNHAAYHIDPTLHYNDTNLRLIYNVRQNSTRDNNNPQYPSLMEISHQLEEESGVIGTGRSIIFTPPILSNTYSQSHNDSIGAKGASSNSNSNSNATTHSSTTVNKNEIHHDPYHHMPLCPPTTGDHLLCSCMVPEYDGLFSLKFSNICISHDLSLSNFILSLNQHISEDYDFTTSMSALSFDTSQKQFDLVYSVLDPLFKHLIYPFNLQMYGLHLDLFPTTKRQAYLDEYYSYAQGKTPGDDDTDNNDDSSIDRKADELRHKQHVFSQNDLTLTVDHVSMSGSFMPLLQMNRFLNIYQNYFPGSTIPPLLQSLAEFHKISSHGDAPENESNPVENGYGNVFSLLEYDDVTDFSNFYDEYLGDAFKQKPTSAFTSQSTSLIEKPMTPQQLIEVTPSSPQDRQMIVSPPSQNNIESSTSSSPSSSEHESSPSTLRVEELRPRRKSVVLDPITQQTDPLQAQEPEQMGDKNNTSIDSFLEDHSRQTTLPSITHVHDDEKNKSDSHDQRLSQDQDGHQTTTTAADDEPELDYDIPLANKIKYTNTTTTEPPSRYANLLLSYHSNKILPKDSATAASSPGTAGNNEEDPIDFKTFSNGLAIKTPESRSQLMLKTSLVELLHQLLLGVTSSFRVDSSVAVSLNRTSSTPVANTPYSVAQLYHDLQARPFNVDELISKPHSTGTINTNDNTNDENSDDHDTDTIDSLVTVLRMHPSLKSLYKDSSILVLPPPPLLAIFHRVTDENKHEYPFLDGLGHFTAPSPPSADLIVNRFPWLAYIYMRYLQQQQQYQHHTTSYNSSGAPVSRGNHSRIMAQRLDEHGTTIFNYNEVEFQVSHVTRTQGNSSKGSGSPSNADTKMGQNSGNTTTNINSNTDHRSGSGPGVVDNNAISTRLNDEERVFTFEITLDLHQICHLEFDYAYICQLLREGV